LLDEIDVLPPEQQAKLLRVIETGEYEPVGSNETQHSQARLIVASNFNLEQLVRAGSFRTDLYYRLNILNFRLLPLRERPWDIEFLARRFALEHSRTHGIQLRTIEPAFLETLRAYHWPGNVREMENVVRRAVLYCHRGVLTVNDLPSSIRDVAAGGPLLHSQPPSEPATAQPAAGITAPPAHRITGEVPLEFPLPPSIGPRVRVGSVPAYPLRSALPVGMTSPPVAEPLSGPPAFAGREPATAVTGQTGGVATAAMRASHSLEARVDVMERRIIQDSLARNNYRRKETAAELGISRVTLYNKMKKFGLL
jgi:DNA-binding NtrC family response regulator